MTDPAGLIEWLRAQLDEDERVALDAAGAPWSTRVPRAIHVDAHAQAENRALRQLGYVATVEHEADRIHIAAWDPARVLAEVKAKRAVLDGLIAYLEGDYAPWNEDLIQLLAQPYAGREGWRDEWSVTT